MLTRNKVSRDGDIFTLKNLENNDYGDAQSIIDQLTNKFGLQDGDVVQTWNELAGNWLTLGHRNGEFTSFGWSLRKRTPR